MTELISLILNALFGSGLIISLATLKSTKAKAKNEADKSLVDNFNDYIVQPLKTEVNELRQSITKLNRAIAKINTCPHADNCPVRNSLEHSDDDNDNELQDSETNDQPPI